MIYYLCLAYVCVALLTLVISILFGGEKKVAGKKKAARRVTLPVGPAAPTKKPRSEVSWSEQDESAHVRHVWSWACAEEPVSLVEVDDVEMVEVDDVEIVDEHADVVPNTVVEWCVRVGLDNGVWLHRPSILPPILEESFESTALEPWNAASSVEWMTGAICLSQVSTYATYAYEECTLGTRRPSRRQLRGPDPQQWGPK
jgi:hypothetical protein